MFTLNLLKSVRLRCEKNTWRDRLLCLHGGWGERSVGVVNSHAITLTFYWTIWRGKGKESSWWGDDNNDHEYWLSMCELWAYPVWCREGVPFFRLHSFCCKERKRTVMKGAVRAKYLRSLLWFCFPFFFPMLKTNAMLLCATRGNQSVGDWTETLPVRSPWKCLSFLSDTYLALHCRDLSCEQLLGNAQERLSASWTVSGVAAHRNFFLTSF